MINANTLILTAAINQMEDWIAFLEDCEGEGFGEPEEMISFLQSQIQTIIQSSVFFSTSVKC
jgi:hypothetical protein